MARWTQSAKERSHLVQINENLYQALNDGFIIRLIMNNGEKVEGVYAGSHFRNDASPNNPITNYCCEITLHLLNGDITSIDFLDIREVVNVTSPDKLKEYAAAGVIIIDKSYKAKS